jgi:hypothetical protein
MGKEDHRSSFPIAKRKEEPAPPFLFVMKFEEELCSSSNVIPKG